MKCPCQVMPNNNTASSVTDHSSVTNHAVTDHTMKSYANCCQPFHTGSSIPQTAEQLMRSRYSAFVLVDVPYIVATTLPAQQALLDKQAIADWAKQTDWAGLEIVKHTPKVGKRHAQVEFKAFFHADEQQDKHAQGELEQGKTILQAHHELSSFVKATNKLSDKPSNKLDGKSDNQQTQLTQWYFLDPTVSLNISQKQPCICGSGEKYKRCCGRFLD